MSRPRDPRTLAAFGGAILLGGSNYVAVTFSNREFAPFFGATVRFAIASSLFVLLARMRRLARLAPRRAGLAAVYGVIGFGAAYACLYVALLDLSAGTLATILASVPLLTLLIAGVVGQERITTRGIVGGLLALVGIAILSAGKLGGELPVGALVAALGGALSSAGATVIAKGMPDAHPIQLNAYGMGAGTLFLLAASLVTREAWEVPERVDTWLALGWLGTVGSMGLFLSFLYVVHRWTASAAVYALTAMPIVAAALGATLLDQPITGQLFLGAAVIAVAVVVGARPAPRDEPLGAEPTVS